MSVGAAMVNEWRWTRPNIPPIRTSPSNQPVQISVMTCNQANIDRAPKGVGVTSRQNSQYRTKGALIKMVTL